MNVYIADIKSQPAALRAAVHKFQALPLESIRSQLALRRYDRLIISGMGASYNAAYPAYLSLSQGKLPVNLVNTAELLNYMSATIGPETLLWLNSQSGRSIEILRLLEQLNPNPPAAILGCVNESDSLLAAAANVVLPIHAGEEATVSVKTYSNMLAVNLLAAAFLMGDPLEGLTEEILTTADKIETYLQDWDEHISRLDQLTEHVDNLVFTGRGSSMAAVWNSALISKEAAKCAYEGMHAAEFRHGPLELCQPGFLAVIFGGSEQTLSQNRALGEDVRHYGGEVIWVADSDDPQLPTFVLPKVSEQTRPLVEILVGQMLSVVFARRKGIEPGYFRYVGKVTVKE